MTLIKNLLYFFSIFLGPVLIAQERLTMEIDNPAPRVGDKVEFTIDFSFLDEFISDELGDDIEIEEDAFHLSQISGIKKTISFKKKGRQVVGPFNFELNGQSFETDSIIVDVAEKLPFEEGVWIRFVTDSKDKRYIILEQYMKNKVKIKTKKKRGKRINSSVPKIDDNEMVELMDINEKGVSIGSRFSSILTRYPESADQFSRESGMRYKRAQYEIKLSVDFKEPFEVNEKYVKNLPNNVSFTPVVIN